MNDRSHHRPEGGFQNPWPGAPPPGHTSFLSWLRAHRGSRPFPVDPPASAFEIVAPSFAQREANDTIAATWIGHATFLIQVGPLNILTDPVWGTRVPPLPVLAPRRWVPPPFALNALPPLDAILLSHNHYDHLEAASVRWLARAHPEAVWLVPLGLKRFVRALGAAQVHELDWWQSASLGGATFVATPAQHHSARTLFDRFRSLWCGWAIVAGAHRVYFAGDTAYFPEFARIGATFGPLNLAVLPIGSYEPRSFMQYVHMSPEESVQAFQDLFARVSTERPPLMLPMHWGTFKLTIEALDEPPRRLVDAWQTAGLPESSLRILKHGETVRY